MTTEQRSRENCGITWDVCFWCLGLTHRSGLDADWTHDRWWDALRCRWGQLACGRVHSR